MGFSNFQSTICKEWEGRLKWYALLWVIMTAIASQITSLTIVYSTIYSDADQRKHQSSASLAFVGNSPVTGEFPAQMASNAENVSIWWRHHERQVCRILCGIHYATLNLNLNHDLTLYFWIFKANFYSNCISGMDNQYIWNKGCFIRQENCYPGWPCPWPWHRNSRLNFENNHNFICYIRRWATLETLLS